MYKTSLLICLSLAWGISSANDDYNCGAWLTLVNNSCNYLVLGTYGSFTSSDSHIAPNKTAKLSGWVQQGHSGSWVLGKSNFPILKILTLDLKSNEGGYENCAVTEFLPLKQGNYTDLSKYYKFSLTQNPQNKYVWTLTVDGGYNCPTKP